MKAGFYIKNYVPGIFALNPLRSEFSIYSSFPAMLLSSLSSGQVSDTRKHELVSSNQCRKDLLFNKSSDQPNGGGSFSCPEIRVVTFRSVISSLTDPFQKSPTDVSVYFPHLPWESSQLTLYCRSHNWAPSLLGMAGSYSIVLTLDYFSTSKN